MSRDQFGDRGEPQDVQVLLEGEKGKGQKVKTRDAVKIVWPWALDKFTGSKRDLSLIKDRLYDRGIQIKKMAEFPPPEKRIAAAEKLLVSLMNKREDGEVPWALLIGQNSTALQSLAELVPVGYTLTTMASMAIVTSAQLVDLFFQRHPTDLWDDDPAGESMDEFKRAGCLSWLEVASMIGGAATQQGRFAELMGWRLKYRLLTVMTASLRDDGLKKMSGDLDKAVGQACAVMIETNSMQVNVKAPKAVKDQATLEV